MAEYTLQDISSVDAVLEEYSLVDLFDAQVELGSNAIQLTSPANGATGVSISPTFEWQSLPNTTKYIVKVWDYTGDVKGSLITEGYSTETTFTVPEPLQNSTKYLWQVVKGSLIDAMAPEPTPEITGINISSGSTINVGGSKTFTISTTGTGDYDDSYTASGAGLTFSINGNLLTVTEGGGFVNDTKTFTVEAVADNTVTDSRTLTIVEQGAIETNDSVQTDFEALQAIYNATQGQNLPTLASTGDLPSVENATYPFMYLIDGDIHWVRFDDDGGVIDWNNAGPAWTDKTGWDTMTAETMGDAVGITVDADGRVVEVDMQKVTTSQGSYNGILTNGNNLCGELPPEVGNLKRCSKFNVKQNFLYGELPAEFGFIGTALERLSLAGHHWEINLDSNRLWVEPNHTHYNTNGGSDPFSWYVANKQVTDTNRFKSDLPPEWGNCSNLDLLELNHQFITGSLPSEWGALTNIRGLLIDLSRDCDGAIYSDIPTSWDNMTNMKYFKISGSIKRTLRGVLPSGMLNWDNLVNIAVNDNELEGEFPGFLNVRDMFYFNIGNNNFGLLVDDQGNETRTNFPWSSLFNGDNSGLSKFQIRQNNFTGELPATIPPPTYPRSFSNYIIDDFSVQNNNFSGALPSWVQSLLGLQIVNISDNNFTGGFPEGLMDQPNLKVLYIQRTGLTGTLPDKGWRTNRMNWFYISGLGWEGEIPEKWISLFLTDTDTMPFSSYQTFTGTGATLTWDAVANAIAYDVEIRTDDSASTLVKKERWMQTEELVVSGLDSGNYKWRVRGLVYRSSSRRFYFQSNELTGRIPDWPKNVNPDEYSVASNRYTFKDVADVYAGLVADLGTGFKVGSQKPFGEAQTVTVASGGSYTIDYSEFDTAGNSYTWYKDGSVISGETGSSLTVASFGASDEGSYKVQVTNSNYPAMGTIESRITTLLL